MTLYLLSHLSVKEGHIYKRNVSIHIHIHKHQLDYIFI